MNDGAEAPKLMSLEEAVAAAENPPELTPEELEKLQLGIVLQAVEACLQVLRQAFSALNLNINFPPGQDPFQRANQELSLLLGGGVIDVQPMPIPQGTPIAQAHKKIILPGRQ